MTDSSRSYRGPTATSRWLWRLCLWSLAVVWIVPTSASCKSAPEKKSDEAASTSDEPIRPGDEQQSTDFEEARRALEDGDWERAEEAFQLLQTESDEGPESQLAELYVGRAKAADLTRSESKSGGSRSELDRSKRRALQLFGSLRESGSVDERVRRAAMIYSAILELRGGRTEAARELFADFPGYAIGPSVLERDRRIGWSVLVEGLAHVDRSEDAVEAASRAFEWIADISTDADADGVADAVESGGTASKDDSDDGDDGAARLADDETVESTDLEGVESAEIPDDAAVFVDFLRSRGFTAADSASMEWAEKRLEAESPFVRALAGWRYLKGRLAQSKLSERQRTRIEEVYRRTAVDLARIGGSDRVEELSVRMATVGGGRRLAIGLLLPLSGSNAGVGRRAMAGGMLAARAFESRAAARVTVVVADSTRSPAEVMDKFERQGVAAIVGPLGVDRAEAFGRLAVERELPMLSLTPRPASLEGQKDSRWVFRNFMDPVTEARAVAQLAVDELGDRRAAVLHPSIGYGRRVQRAFAEVFRERGGEVVTTIAYDRSKSDYSSLADRVDAARVDSVFVADSADKVAEVSAFLADRGIWGRQPGKSSGEGAESDGGVHYLGTSLWQAPILLDQASDYVQGSLIPAWYAPAFEDRRTRLFSRRFRAVFDRKPGNIEAFTFDSIDWLRSLMLERGIYERAALREALVGERQYGGTTGEAWFDGEGRLWRKLRFLTVGEEGFEPLEYEREVVAQPPDSMSEGDVEGGDELSAPDENPPSDETDRSQ